MRWGAFWGATLALTLLTGCATSLQHDRQVELSQWLEEADLQGHQTPEELYQQALEEDVLIVYSTTTRIYDVKESFEAEYPGLLVEVYDTRAPDLVESLKTAYESGEWICDVVICADDNGVLSQELIPNRILNKYVPPSIVPHMQEASNGDLLEFTIEAEQLFYNPAVYGTCPVDNWWELTEPQWKNKVYINSPLRSYAAYGFFHAVLEKHQEMEAAYVARYGMAPELSEGQTAGELFFERLVANGLQLTTSSNDLVELVGNDNTENSPLAFMISSKIRRQDIGLQVEAAYGLLPADGVISTNSISIAGGAENVATAKLFIYHLLGGEDGAGEGLTPYLLEGTWSVRNDIVSQSRVALSQGVFWRNNPAVVWSQLEELTAYWSVLQVQVDEAAYDDD